MTLGDKPLLNLIEAFRSPSPTPGGGSGAALAGAVGAALLAMAASLPKHRAVSEEDVARLQDAGRRTTEIASRLAALVDEDARAYDGVIAAYRLPKGSDDERAARHARIQEALVGAASVPLEMMRQCAGALQLATIVRTLANVHAATDVGVGVELLGAAVRGAALNVGVNVADVDDQARAAQIRQECEALAARCGTRDA